jgi:hypothetical protein
MGIAQQLQAHDHEYSDAYMSAFTTKMEALTGGCKMKNVDVDIDYQHE